MLLHFRLFTTVLLCFPILVFGGPIDVKDQNAINELQNQIKKLEAIIEASKSKGAIKLDITEFKTDAKTLLQQNYAETVPALGKDAMQKYLGKGEYCRGEGASYASCVAIRNTKAAMLADLEKMLTQTDTRVKYVNALIDRANKGGLTQGELQTLIAQINAYQTLIQTDAIRMNAAMEVYKQRLAVYQQQQQDHINRLLYGSGSTGGATGGLPLNFK